MKKKVILLSTVLAVLVVLGGLSSPVTSKDLKIAQRSDTVTVEVNRYYGKGSSPILTELSYEEAEELKEILINLEEAIENNDEEAIDQYETILNERGLFGNNYQEFYSNNEFTEMMEKSGLSKYQKYFGSKNGDNISNTMCYFHATGQGLMLFTLGVKIAEAIIRIVNNASSWLAGIILLLAFLPFLVLTMLVTHLIPFRILMPIGVINMDQGTITSIGLQGVKSLVVDTEPVNVNISWFTGITFNIPLTETPFLFVSGVALDVRPTGT